MTAKRFTITQDFEEHHRQIRDNGKIIMGCFVEPQAEPIVKLLNELHEEKEQLLSDKEHLMGCLIRFFGYDDEDIDYNLNRESNREYGKQYYSMKEETEKELEE